MARRSASTALWVLLSLFLAAMVSPGSAVAHEWVTAIGPTPTPTPDVRSWPPDLTPYVRPIVPGDWTPLPAASPTMTPIPTLTRPPGARDRPLTPTPDVRSWPPDLSPYVRPIMPGDRATLPRYAPCARLAPHACGCRRVGVSRPAMR